MTDTSCRSIAWHVSTAGFAGGDRQFDIGKTPEELPGVIREQMDQKIEPNHIIRVNNPPSDPFVDHREITL